MVIDMRNNNWFQVVADVLLTCEVGYVVRSRVQSCEIHRQIITEPPHQRTVGLIFPCRQTPSRPAVARSRNLLSSEKWILCQGHRFPVRRAKHHTKRKLWWWYASSGRLMTLPDAIPAAFKWFLGVLVGRRRRGSHCRSRNGLVANVCGRTNRSNNLSACYDVTWGRPDFKRPSQL